MGINICMVDEDLKEIEDWDSCRYGGDNDFTELLYSVDSVEHENNEGYRKPVNVDDLKVLIDNWGYKYKQRFYHFCWLLRKHKAYYFISY